MQQQQRQHHKQNAITTTTTTKEKYNNENNNNNNNNNTKITTTRTTQTTTKNKQPAKTNQVWTLAFSLGPPESTATQNSGDTPGVNWKHLSRPIIFKGPRGPSWALRLLRLRIFSPNQGPAWSIVGPLNRALYKDQS